MFRWTLVTVVSLSFLTSLAAAPTPPKDSTKPTEKPAKIEKADEVSLEENDQFNLTKEAEIRLDGRPVQYSDVPDSAVIVNMQVAPDRRTIVRIHFRSSK